LEECHKAARLWNPQLNAHTTALAAMTAAAVAAASALPPHTLQSTIFAAMTAATIHVWPSDFATSKSAGSCINPSVELSSNKLHQPYLVFSLVPTVQLPMIANTRATQHTTNQQDLLHDFFPLTTPSRLVR